MDTPPTKRSIQNFETARWERESKKWAGRKLYEIDYIMDKNNYELFDLSGIHYSKKSQIKWFDMLYINKNFSQQTKIKDKVKTI